MYTDLCFHFLGVSSQQLYLTTLSQQIWVVVKDPVQTIKYVYYGQVSPLKMVSTACSHLICSFV